MIGVLKRMRGKVVEELRRSVFEFGKVMNFVEVFEKFSINKDEEE